MEKMTFFCFHSYAVQSNDGALGNVAFVQQIVPKCGTPAEDPKAWGLDPQGDRHRSDGAVGGHEIVVRGHCELSSKDASRGTQ